MNCLIHALIFHFNILFLFMLIILSEIACIITINVRLCYCISRLHLTIKVINTNLQYLYIRWAILRLWWYWRKCIDFEYLIIFLRLPLCIGKLRLICWFFWDRTLQHNLVETGPSYLLDVDYLFFGLEVLIQIFTFLFLYLLYLTMCLHIPKEGLLIVIPAKINQISY